MTTGAKRLSQGTLTITAARVRLTSGEQSDQSCSLPADLSRTLIAEERVVNCSSSLSFYPSGDRVPSPAKNCVHAKRNRL